MKFEPCDRCGQMVDTESPSVPSHDCETDEDRFDVLMRRIDELESRVSEIEDGAADKRIGEEGVLLCGRMYGHPPVCTLPSDHPGDCRQRTAKGDPEDALDARVAQLDEVCKWLENEGCPDIAGKLYDQRNVFLLETARRIGEPAHGPTDERPYACLACGEGLASHGMCSRCSRAWGMGRDSVQRTETPARLDIPVIKEINTRVVNDDRGFRRYVIVQIEVLDKHHLALTQTLAAFAATPEKGEPR